MAAGWGHGGGEDVYQFLGERLASYGLTWGRIALKYDAIVYDDRPETGPLGDAAVLAYLEERGL